MLVSAGGDAALSSSLQLSQLFPARSQARPGLSLTQRKVELLDCYPGRWQGQDPHRLPQGLSPVVDVSGPLMTGPKLAAGERTRVGWGGGDGRARERQGSGRHVLPSSTSRAGLPSTVHNDSTVEARSGTPGPVPSVLFLSSLIDRASNRTDPSFSHHHLLVHLNPAASPSLPSILSLLLLTRSPPTSFTFFSWWVSREARKAKKDPIQCVGVISIFFWLVVVVVVLLLQVPLCVLRLCLFSTSLLDAGPTSIFSPSPRARTHAPLNHVNVSSRSPPPLHMLTTCIS